MPWRIATVLYERCRRLAEGADEAVFQAAELVRLPAERQMCSRGRAANDVPGCCKRILYL